MHISGLIHSSVIPQATQSKHIDFKQKNIYVAINPWTFSEGSGFSIKNDYEPCV